MKKNKQLSLAQALGDLSGKEKELENLIGLRVVLTRIRRKYRGESDKKQREGTIIEIAKVPGFVIIRDDCGNEFSRSLTQIWEAL